MPMYNLIEYSDNYAKTSGSLWQYYGDKPGLTDVGAIINFSDANINSALLKFKQQITGQTGNDGKKYVQMMVQLKHQSNF